MTIPKAKAEPGRGVACPVCFVHKGDPCMAEDGKPIRAHVRRARLELRLQNRDGKA